MAGQGNGGQGMGGYGYSPQSYGQSFGGYGGGYGQGGYGGYGQGMGNSQGGYGMGYGGNPFGQMSGFGSSPYGMNGQGAQMRQQYAPPWMQGGMSRPQMPQFAPGYMSPISGSVGMDGSPSMTQQRMPQQQAPVQPTAQQYDQMIRQQSGGGWASPSGPEFAY